MILPHLSEFIQTVPVGMQCEGPSQWLESCVQGGLGWVVVVDADRTALSVLTLQEILALPRVSLSSGIGEGERRRSLGSVLPIEEGVVLDRWLRDRPIQHWVSWLQSSEVALQQVVAAPDGKWVVVDENHQYQGVLNTNQLLAIAVSRWEPWARETEAAETPTDRQVSRSNTALLTYLGHELKTPLTSLLGLSSLLKSGGLGDLTPRQTRYVGLIQQHCRRLAVWVNTLIDLGRIDSGSVRIIPQMTDLAPLWQEAYHQAALRVGKEDLHPPNTPALFGYGQSPPALIVDPSRLQQMLSCLMQTALSIQAAPMEAPSEFPLFVEIWPGYVAFMLQTPEDALAFYQISHTVFTPGVMPLPTPLTPLSSEMGHWLEWLLVRKLAQLHQGELTLTMHPQHGLCPVLLLPSSASTAAIEENRLLLLMAPPQESLVSAVGEQATHLNYRLLVTPHLKEALEVAAHLPLSAVLVWVESPQSLRDIQSLKTALGGEETRVVALMPPKWSSLMGESQADLELLWPTTSLGSVLLQPTTIAPPPSRLTILYLKSSVPKPLSADLPMTGEEHFPGLFHTLGCRLLEVDDVEQAELLCRVWKPNVAVLDPAIAHPADVLQTFSQSAQLLPLPLITLTLEATQAAHQLSALHVFPCLIGDVAWETPEASDRMTTWLIRVLQAAVMDP